MSTTTAATRKPRLMTVDEFLAWPGDGLGTRYELVEGELRAQDSASDTHGTIQARLSHILTAYLDKARPGCRVVTAPGIRPHLRADWNYRFPDLGVTCAPSRPDQHAMPTPILLIEIISPSNEADTWSNIPLYASIPSVTEILIISSTRVAAEILRRGEDLSWPQNPAPIGPAGTVALTSIGLDFPLLEAYRGTHLAG